MSLDRLPDCGSGMLATRILAGSITFHNHDLSSTGLDWSRSQPDGHYRHQHFTGPIIHDNPASPPRPPSLLPIPQRRRRNAQIPPRSLSLSILRSGFAESMRKTHLPLTRKGSLQAPGCTRRLQFVYRSCLKTMTEVSCAQSTAWECRLVARNKFRYAGHISTSEM